MENFDKIKEAINDTSFLLNINYEHLFDIVDNKTTNESIKKNHSEGSFLADGCLIFWWLRIPTGSMTEWVFSRSGNAL